MRASRKNLAKIPLFSVGVNVAKDDIYSKLVVDVPGPGYMHFPDKPQYDKAYFDQLTVERRDASGRWVNIGKKRNEAIDCRVYALAAQALSGLSVDEMREPMFYVATASKKRRRIISSGVRR